MSGIGVGQGQEGVSQQVEGVHGLSIHWALLTLGVSGCRGLVEATVGRIQGEEGHIFRFKGKKWMWTQERL